MSGKLHPLKNNFFFTPNNFIIYTFTLYLQGKAGIPSGGGLDRPHTASAIASRTNGMYPGPGGGGGAGAIPNLNGNNNYIISFIHFFYYLSIYNDLL